MFIVKSKNEQSIPKFHLVEHLWTQKSNNTYWNKTSIQSRSNMSKTQPIGGEVCELVNVWSSYLCRSVCELSNASEFSPCEVVNLWNILGRAFICLHCVGGLKLYSKLSKLFSFSKHEIFLGLLYNKFRNMHCE